MQEINLEKIWLNAVETEGVNEKTWDDIGRAAMLEFGKQLLELAAKNAKTYTETYCSPYKEEWDKIVDKQSILDTIKQVE